MAIVRVIGVLIVSAVLCAPAMAQLSPPAPGNVYLGIWANPAFSSDSEKAIEVREGASPNGVNRRFALHLHYYGWADLAAQLGADGTFHPDKALAGDIAHDRVPVISWKCDAATMSSDAAIARGDASEDAVILSTAKALAQYPGPVLLRWFWEFNLLGQNQSCRGDSGGAPTPQVYDDFIAAWRHMRQLFQSAGASNVLFLWNPGAGGSDAAAFYPGNSTVDWIGVDMYQRSQNETFANGFDAFYQQFSDSRYGNKPLMLGENGAHALPDYGVEQQAAYFTALLADVRSLRYPLLAGYCYFDSSGNQGDWVLDNSGGLGAFSTLANDPAFSPMPPPRPKRRAARHP